MRNGASGLQGRIDGRDRQAQRAGFFEIDVEAELR